ncbi:ankyrin repeat-containing domain protein [Trichoderma barbatum]
MLDERHPDLPKPSNDSNSYTLGSIGEHNVVIACLPMGQYGTNSATNVATLMIRAFPFVKIGLLVGIGGGVPPKVRLGDVVVSTPVDQYPGVVQYDFGKATIEGNGLERIGALSNPPVALLTALAKLKTEHELTGPKIPKYLEELKEKYFNLAKSYLKSKSLKDDLFRADYHHVSAPFHSTGFEASQETEDEEGSEEDAESCSFCDKSKAIKRKNRSMRVHHGLIASGNKVIKDASYREEVNGALGGKVLCFETEAAGLMNNIPCLVIRGICDYCDSHKNNAWQKYAAAVAAAFAKELLYCLQPGDMKREQPLKDAINNIRQDIQCVYKKVENGFMETKRRLDELHDDSEVKKQKETLNWLSPLDFPLLQHDYFRRCAPDTGQEFLRSVELQNWLSASKQTMFCQGDPGAGKTFQMAILVNYLVEKYRDDDTNAEQMIASLVKQLAQMSTPFPEVVHQLRDRHCPMKSRPLLGELSNTLTALIKPFSRVFILIDALDEGHDSDRTRFLGEIFAIQEKTDLNLFATSRTINSIAAEFEDRSISRDISPTCHDIFQSLNARMSALPLFVAKDTALQKEIRESVESAIGGMFLLAQLYIDSLVGKRSPESLRTALRDLRHASSSPDRSKVLDEAYDKSMERIQQLNGDLPRDALLILSWIVKARRQIKLAEIKEALAVEMGASKLNTDNVPMAEHIIQACASLVIIEGDTIELVHYTAQEYFERPNNKWMQKAQMNITNTCIAYLSLSTFRDESCISQEDFHRRVEHNPFYSYSAEYWVYHTNEALAQGLEVSSVLKFLEYGLIRGSWYQDLLYGYSQNSFRPKFVPMQLTALHVAALFGLHDVAAKLLEQGYSPNVKDSLSRMPIWWAGWSGSDRVVQILLDGATDIETRDLEYGSTPLLIASRRGHKTVVELLLKKCNIESKDSSGWTSLNVAAQFGNKAVFDLLVNKGADIEVKDNDCQTPLAIAAKLGHMNAVEWLLEKGADIEATDSKTRTPLMLATMGGHEGVVRHLIENGAHMKVMDDKKQTLSAKTIRDKLDLWLLIEEGADVEAKDNDGNTPLSRAAYWGKSEAVQLLLANNANIEAKNNSGDTPLGRAAFRGNLEAIQLLLVNNANIEAKSNSGNTPLGRAAFRGNLEAIQLLLANNANMKARNHNNRTPLAEATYACECSAVKLLLDNKASPDHRGFSGRTLMHIAAEEENLDLVRVLLAFEAVSVDEKDNNGRTPLSHAMEHGEGAIVKALLNSGKVKANSRDNKGRTPLSYAASFDVNLKDKQGKTAIWYATKAGDEELVKLLRKHGAKSKRSWF